MEVTEPSKNVSSMSGSLSQIVPCQSLSLPARSLRSLICRFKPVSSATQKPGVNAPGFCVVGVTGLEPATSRPPAVRASQLRHTPNSYSHILQVSG